MEIKAMVDTVLKKSPDQSSLLEDDEKRSVEAGTVLRVKEYQRAKDDQHYFIELQDGEKWYIYDPVGGGHWQCEWENDGVEDDVEVDRKIVPASQWKGNFQDYVTPHFKWGEFFNWSENRKTFNPVILRNIQAIAQKLEGVRAYLGGYAIKIHSGYRPPAINAAVGGASRSQHLTGGAVDISVPGLNIFDVQTRLDKYWDGALGYGAKKGFVHLDLRPTRIRWNY